MPKTLDEIIVSRRSTRKYTDKLIDKEVLKQILEAARLAPSACNAQPWRFVVISENDKKKELLKEGLGVVVPNSWAKTAAAVVVVCSDLDLFTHKVAEKIQGVHYHLIDIGIACEHLVLKAEELGIGSCYIGWFDSKGIIKTLGLPASWKVDCLITLGYPEQVPNPTPRKPLEEIAFIDPKKIG